MSFKQSGLWKAAFEASRDDASREEQLRLAACYDAMRKRASALVAKIQSDLPHMTIHDVTHLDALWDMASIAAGDNFDLNPAEAFVFGGAVLLHDAAMTLAAYPGGIAELRLQTEWRDLHARYVAAIPADDPSAARDAENRATADALRLLHAKQAEKLPSVSPLPTVFATLSKQSRRLPNLPPSIRSLLTGKALTVTIGCQCSTRASASSDPLRPHSRPVRAPRWTIADLALRSPARPSKH